MRPKFYLRRLRRALFPAPRPASPKVSVIVPVFDVAPWLDACLDVLVDQSFTDFEIIAVDDGSRDASPAILARWARRDRRLRVITQRNRGLSAARNTGLDVARGDWIAFVDSDDLPTRHYLRDLLEAAERTGAPLAVCAIDYLMPGGAARYHPTLHAPDRIAPHRHDGVIDLSDKRLLAEFFPSAWNKLYARRLFETLRFPEGLNYEDHPVFFAIGFAIDRCAYIETPLYRQRIERAGAITQDRSARNFDILPILRQVWGIIAAGLPPETARPMFVQLALRLLWERSTCLDDRADLTRLREEGLALLAEAGALGVEPQAEDRWIDSDFTRRLKAEAQPPS